jgi:exopolyphosphatase/guanosine-5'-triphosphate,3'-diphosphate pyrophosphatase
LIVPRWEWRTFGESFGEAEDRLRAASPAQLQECDELYLLSRESDASVKVRDELMDVKHLERVDENGLEQWKPVMKAPFPLAAADVEQVLTELGITVPPLARSEYTLEDLLGEDLLTVEVHKRRERHTIDGCMAELTEIRTEHGSTRTLAVESEDAARVLAVVGDLGLASRRNVNVARGLKTLVGFGAHRYAVLDIGTNSVKFIVGERAADGSWRTIVDRAEVTRLGEGLDKSGQLGEEPMERTVEAIAAMAEEARRNGVEAVAAVGTAWMRLASNSAAFIEAVRERTGIEVEAISGEEEGRLAYLAVTAALGIRSGSVVVFDTGGGSSQFTFAEGDRVLEQFSLNVGAARFTERFGLDGIVDDETLAAARAAIAADLAPLDGRPTPDALIGMGGAVTNLTAVKLGLAKYDPEVVQGSVLDAGEIERQTELYRTRSAEQRREIVGLQPKRAEVILAGALIVRAALTKLGRDSLVVSDRGLRHGLLVERFSQ